MSSHKKIVLITGANQGIGFETAKNLLLSSADYHILLGSRDHLKGISAASSLQSSGIKGTVEPIQLDVTDDDSVDAAATYVKSAYGHLDILVNNAGIASKNPSARVRLRDILAVNTVGVYSVTEAFLPLLRESSSPRMVVVSSALGSFAEAIDPMSTYYKITALEYRASKAAVNMLIVEYQKALASDGFKIFAVCPGLVATNISDAEAVRKRGGAEPEVGGERVARLVRGDQDEDSGKFIGPEGQVYAW